MEMSSLLIFVLIIIILEICPALLPWIIKKPFGPNRYGRPSKPMTLSLSVTTCLKNYAVFSGRASRSEFWWFHFIYFLIYVGLVIVGKIVQFDYLPLVSFCFFLPVLGACIRRLHDINRSGWWILLSISLGGLFVLLYLWVQPTQVDESDTARVFE